MIVLKTKRKLKITKIVFSKFQKGTSLIEILVTLFIMAIGLLGLAAMQINSSKNINNSQFRSLAVSYAYDMAERMRSNPVGVSAGDYVALKTVSASAPTCMGSSCGTSDMAQLDSFEWAQQLGASVLSGGLPSGEGIVSGSVGTGVYDIQVTWDEQDRDNTGGVISNSRLTLTIQL
ncbi:type IV pilus modification protein PilV [Psychromonas sp. PT13]|uniref:type IV pilus modification protein PilV n=1 Tax=Psychromonas sp. PT13 TaxID=3439547 RepID=UPI003EBFA13A